MQSETPKYLFTALTPDLVVKYWSDLEPQITRALPHGGHELTIAGILKGILNETIQCFVILNEDNSIETVFTTQIVEFENYKAMQFLTCGGKIHDVEAWGENNIHFENFAKANGCKSLRLVGRKGWGRFLTKIKSSSGTAYEPLYTTFEMELK